MSGHQVVNPPEIPGFTFVRPLGAGGYSDVFLYEQAMPKRQVAVKVLRDSGLDESIRRQFTAEANTMAELADHPNIVSVISAEVANDGRPYLVMAYYSKDNLGVRAERERFGVSEVVRIGIQITSAVETAHRAGILHRDIKPANILTNQFNTVGLTDFGIAAQVTAEEDDDTGVSVPWSAPEVLYATASASVQSDVYALGATLWHLLVGRSPYEVTGGGDNSPLALMRRTRDLPVPATGRADVPPSLERLLAQAMAKDPAARPASALDFARSLQSIEQELKLPRTDIVVITEEEEEVPTRAPEPVAPVDDANKTRMRAPVNVNPEVPKAAPRPAAKVAPVLPVVPEPSARTVRRPKVIEADGERPFTPAAVGGEKTDATVRRPVSTDAQPAPVPVPQKRKGIKPAVLVAVLAGVVLVAGLVGVVLASGGSGGKDKAAADATTRTVAQPDDIGPPGSPTVTGARVDPGNLKFTWTYSNDADTDSYLWQTEDGAQRGTSETPEVVLPSAGPACVQVKVVRADGRNAALSWSKAGCAQ